MKKKPIYLYVLLGLSAIGTLLGVWSRFFSKFSEVDYTQINFSKELSDQTNQFNKLYFEFLRNGMNMLIFFVMTALLIASIVFLVRKNLQMANISYIVYILVSLLSQVYVYISSKGIVGKVFTSPENIATHSNSLLLGTALGFVISLIYLSIVVFKLIQQQKEAEKAELAAKE